MKRFGTFVIFLILAWLLFSCGSAHHLRRAERLKKRMDEQIQKAVEKGATVRRDTVFQRVSFKVPGIKVEFTPKIISDKSLPMIFIKDSVITKVVIRPGINGRDTVYVETDCPDQVAEKDVAVGINQDIDAKQNYNFWDILKWFLIAFILGGLVRHFWPVIRRLVMMV